MLFEINELNLPDRFINGSLDIFCGVFMPSNVNDITKDWIVGNNYANCFSDITDKELLLLAAKKTK